jgi:hypothetical protein
LSPTGFVLVGLFYSSEKIKEEGCGMETIESLRDRLEALEKQTQALVHQTRADKQRLRWWRMLACGSLVLGMVMLPLVGGTAQEQSMYERAMARRLSTLEYKLQYIEGGPNEVVITGANLRIVNGDGAQRLRMSWAI